MRLLLTSATKQFGALLLCTGLLCAASPKPRLDGKYVVTAYSVTGETASGQYTHRHVVAADPDILPIGSRIRIRHAGKYSGEYVVADTGEKIVGRKLDIYMPNTAECKRFGKKVLHVKVLELGAGTHQAAKQADQVVKQEVAKDMAKGTVGNAATQVDWQQNKHAQQAGAQVAAGQQPAAAGGNQQSAASTHSAASPTTAASQPSSPQQRTE